MTKQDIFDSSSHTQLSYAQLLSLLRHKDQSAKHLLNLLSPTLQQDLELLHDQLMHSHMGSGASGSRFIEILGEQDHICLSHYHLLTLLFCGA
jgi:hypothetical protein